MWILSMLATGRSSKFTDNSGLKICRWLEGNLVNMGMTVQVFDSNQILAQKSSF